MAISLRTPGTWVAANATTQTVTLPTHAAGDMLLVRVAFKHATMPTTVTCGTAGWNKVGQYNNGATVSGNGTGSVIVAVFYKEATSASETNPVITYHASVAATPSAAVGMAYQKASTDNWLVPLGAGGPTGTTTSLSATITSHISTTVGDLVDFFHSQCDDNTLTVPTFTQASLTLNTVTESPATALSSGTSNDINADGGYRIVTAGTSSAAAVVTGTSSAGDQGSAWTTRLRVNAVGAMTVDAVITKTQSNVLPGDVPTFVNSATATKVWSVGTSVTITKPTGTADGDLMIAFIAGDPQSTERVFTPPAGWVEFAHLHNTSGSGGDTGYNTMFAKVAASEGANYIFAWGAPDTLYNGGMVGGIVTFSGASYPPLVATNASAAQVGTMDTATLVVPPNSVVGAAYTSGGAGTTSWIHDSDLPNELWDLYVQYAAHSAAYTAADLTAGTKGPYTGDYSSTFSTIALIWAAPAALDGGILLDAYLAAAGGPVTQNGSFTIDAILLRTASSSTPIEANFFETRELASGISIHNRFAPQVVYANARSGTGMQDTSDGVHIAHQRLQTPSNAYSVGETFMEFATTSLAPGTTVLSASLRLVQEPVEYGSTAPASNLEFFAVDFGSSVTAGDYVPGDTLAGLTVVGTSPSSGWLGTAGTAVFNIDIDADAISVGSPTRLIGAPERLRTNNAPGSGNNEENFVWRSYFGDHDTGDDPILTVEYLASLSITLDAWIAGRFLLDAVILKPDNPGSFTLDAVILKPVNPGSFTLDACINATVGGSFLIDASLLGAPVGDFTLNAVLLDTFVFAGLFDPEYFDPDFFDTAPNIDAFIVGPAITGSFTLDACINATASGSFTLDAVILAGQAGSFLLDAVILRPDQTGSLTLDAVVNATVSGSFTLDAWIAGAFTLDAEVAGTGVQGSFTLDALINATVDGDAFTLDALIRFIAFEDTFTRTVSGGWGSDNYGLTGADALSASVNGSELVVATNEYSYARNAQPMIQRGWIRIDFKTPPVEDYGHFLEIDTAPTGVSTGGPMLLEGWLNDDLEWHLDLYPGSTEYDFAITYDTWYSVVAWVDYTPGSFVALKVWPRDDPEPDEWSVEGTVPFMGSWSTSYFGFDAYNASPFYADNFRLDVIDLADYFEYEPVYTFTLDAVIRQRGFTADAVELKHWDRTVAPTYATLVGSASTSELNHVSSIIVAKPSGVASGDLMFMSVMAGDGASNPTITVSGGWTNRGNITRAGPQYRASLFTRVAGGSEPSSYTVSASVSSSINAVATAWRDATTFGTLGYGYDSASLGAVAPYIDVPIPSISHIFSGTPGTLVGFALSSSFSSGTITPPSGWTLVHEKQDFKAQQAVFRQDLFQLGGPTAAATATISNPDAGSPLRAGWAFLLTNASRGSGIPLDAYIPQHFSIDAYIFGGGTFTLDAVFRADIFSLDASIVLRVSEVFVLSAFISRNVFTLDAVVQAGGLSTLDALVNAHQPASFTVDAVITSGTYREFTTRTLDAVMRATISATTTLWAELALVVTVVSEEVPLDAVCLDTIAASLLLDAVISDGVQEATFTLDADIAGANEERGSANIDAVIRLGAGELFILEAQIAGNGFFWIDAWLAGSFTLDAEISANTVSSSFTVDATTRQVIASSFTLNADKRGANEQRGTFTLDAAVVGSRSGEPPIFLDALLVAGGSAGFTADAWVGGGRTIDAFIAPYFAVNAYIRGNATIVYPEDGSPPLDPDGNPWPDWFKASRKYRIKITVGGVNVTGDVIWAQTTFTQNAKTGPGNFDLALNGAFDFEGGEEIAVEVDDLRTFGGYVMSVERAYVFESDLEPQTVLRGTDYNVLFDRLFAYNKDSATGTRGHYANWRSFAKGTHDDVIIRKIFRDYVDRPAGLDFTTYVDDVGVAAIEVPWAMPTPGSSLRQAMQSLSQVTTSVWWIDPYLNLHNHARTTITAPYPITDGYGGISSRNLSVMADMTQMVNETLVWGTVARNDDYEINADREGSSESRQRYGTWQYGEFRADLHHTSYINRRAESIIERYEEPIFRAKATVFEPGYQAGQGVEVISTAHGVSEVLVIRSLELTFAVIKEPAGDIYYGVPRYELTIGLDPESPWNIYDFLPFDDSSTPWHTPWDRCEDCHIDECEENGPTDGGGVVCGITDSFDREPASGWGVSDLGIDWAAGGGSTGSVAITWPGYGSMTTSATAGSPASQKLVTEIPATVTATVKFRAGTAGASLGTPVGGTNDIVPASLILGSDTFARSVSVSVYSRRAGAVITHYLQFFRQTFDEQPSPIEVVAGTWYYLKLSSVPGSAIRAKVWAVDDEEPTSWVTSTQITSASSSVFDYVSVGVINQEDVSGALTTEFDDLEVEDLFACEEEDACGITDDFARVVASPGWGTSDAGIDWSTSDSFGDTFVNDGAGKLTLTGGGGSVQATASLGTSIIGIKAPYSGETRSMRFSLVNSAMTLSDLRWDIRFTTVDLGVATNYLIFTPTESWFSWVSDVGSGTEIPSSFWSDGTVYTWTQYAVPTGIESAITDGITTYTTGLASFADEAECSITTTLIQKVPFVPSNKEVHILTLTVPEFTRCSQYAFDVFDRDESSGWGTSTDGHPWTVGAGTWSTDEGKGYVTQTTSGREATVGPDGAGPWMRDEVTLTVVFAIANAPTGTSDTSWLYTSYQMQSLVQMAFTDGPPISGLPKSYIQCAGETTFIPHTFWVDDGIYTLVVERTGGTRRASISRSGVTYTTAFGPESSTSEYFGISPNINSGTQTFTFYSMRFDYDGQPVYCTGGVFDNFDRTEAFSWGTATPSGAVWSSAGPGTASWSVGGGWGKSVQGVSGASGQAQMRTADGSEYWASDFDMTTTLRVNTKQTQPSSYSIGLRETGSGGIYGEGVGFAVNYPAGMDEEPEGDSFFMVWDTGPSTYDAVYISASIAQGSTWGCRWQKQDGVMRAKFWALPGDEPDDWDFEETIFGIEVDRLVVLTVGTSLIANNDWEVWTSGFVFSEECFDEAGGPGTPGSDECIDDVGESFGAVHEGWGCETTYVIDGVLTTTGLVTQDTLTVYDFETGDFLSPVDDWTDNGDGKTFQILGSSERVIACYRNYVVTAQSGVTPRIVAPNDIRFGRDHIGV